MCLLIELAAEMTRKKYITMPAYRILATIMLILAGALASAGLQADELKEIAGQIEQGQASAALDRADDYLEAHPFDARAMFLKGVALTELNKRDDAIKIFTEITRKYPKLPEPYNNLAVLYAEQGQYDKARQALEAALKTHPSYATAHDNLAGIYAHMASQAYGRALQLDNKGNRRASADKLAMIHALPVSDKPVMLAAKPAEEKAISKEAAKPQMPATETRAKPAKPVESAKPAEPAKPAVVATAKPEPKTPIPAKAAEPVKKPAAEKLATEKSTIEKPAAATEKQANVGKNIETAVQEAVEAWALAWSSQNVEEYLASYADSFKTPNGESRQQWEETRRDRVSRPADIKVDVANLRVKVEDNGIARAQFKQTYRTGSALMRTNKTLVFRNKGGKWLIEQERTDR